jgi:hypothetical protein
MNRGMFTTAAISILALHAAPALAADALAAPLAPRGVTAEAAATGAMSASRRPEPPPVRAVVAPPKPTVETIVQPGLGKIDKHERVTDILKARKRAGRSDRVVAD